MKLRTIGAAHEVTGSCHLLEVNDKRILIDCGLEQGRNLYENPGFELLNEKIDYVFLTHAHIDHSGKLPLLCKNGFQGQIIATFPTVDLCRIMLQDSAHIQETEAEWQNRKGRRAGEPECEPLYTMDDALMAIDLLVPCGYNERIRIEPGIELRFTDVGHLLGSSSIEVWLTVGGLTKKIVFSGDLGNIGLPILKEPTFTRSADFVVVESTYGNRLHEIVSINYPERLATILRETFSQGGNVVIPSFAVGRTQELLYFFREIKEQDLLPEYADFEVYLDSPLAIEATKVFTSNMRECFDEEALKLVDAGINPLIFPGLKICAGSEDSKAINFIEKPKVILSASGMCEAGRIRHHLKHNLWRKECTILFVGFQAMGTLGRRLVDGADVVRLFGETIEVRARIEDFKGMSGHADQKELLNWLRGFETPLERVIVVHGEDTVTDEFATIVEEELRVSAWAPYPCGELDLASNTVLTDGVKIPIKPRKATQRRDDAAFERLLSAGKQLLDVIYRSESISNKDKARFESQLRNLAEKWAPWEDE